MLPMKHLPKIIQGGMGAGVSDWRLANAVSRAGQLGLVAGTALDVILARRLQAGDPGGHMRRALEAFPIPEIAQRILKRHFIEGGKAADKRFKSKPMPSHDFGQTLDELTVAANFAEVFLAKEGHSNPVGINFLTKIQTPTLPSLFGAMLAGVSVVVMGAGIPTAIPGLLDKLSQGEAVELRLDMIGTDRGESLITKFDPAEFMGGTAPQLDRPDFLAIVSTNAVANIILKKSTGKVQGFVIEAPTAGGHNAPPRAKSDLGPTGEPVYGPRDEPDFAGFIEFGLPFWLAGSRAEPEQLQDALACGASGIQVGTAFAFCQESGFETQYKARVLKMSAEGTAKVFTDPIASPTGFPFKVIQLDDTISNSEVSDARTRVCDLGYLRHAYKTEDSKVGWRCPSEPVDDYLRKGGKLEETVGRKCVCNGLLANIGLPQITPKKDGLELPMFTAGDDVAGVARFIQPGEDHYSAQEVIDYLLAKVTA